MKNKLLYLMCLLMILSTAPAYADQTKLIHTDDFTQAPTIKHWETTGSVKLQSNPNRTLGIHGIGEAVSEFDFDPAIPLTFDIYYTTVTSFKVQVDYLDSQNNLLGQSILYEYTSEAIDTWHTISLEHLTQEAAQKARVYFISSSEANTISLDNVNIPNGDFSAPLEIVGWQVASESITQEEGMLVLSDYRTDANATVRSDFIPISKSETHRVDATLEIMSQSHSLEFAIEYFDDAKQLLQSTNVLLKNKTTSGVFTESLTLASMSNAAYIRVNFNSGKVSLTEARIHKVEIFSTPEDQVEPIESELINPGFEQDLNSDGSIPGWVSVEANTPFEISTDRSHSGTQSLHFQDTRSEAPNAGARILSHKIAITPASTYLASAQVNVVSQTHSIVLVVQYFDRDDRSIQVHEELFSSNSLGTNKWSSLRKLTTAPIDAAYARIGFYSGGISLTNAYFDSVSFESMDAGQELDRHYQNPTNLGTMVDVSLGQAAAIQTNSLGQNEIYYHSNGLPGTFSVIDGDTGALKFSQVIESTEAVWAMTIAPDKNVYFAGTADGRLYRYLPDKQLVEDLGSNPSDKWVWDIEASEDGKIYGSTYPNASLFEYDIASKTFTDHGVTKANQQYARGIAVDDQFVYIGTGTTKHLMRMDRSTGVYEELFIDGISGETGTLEDIHLIDGLLFVSNGTINMLVIEPNTMEVVTKFQYSNKISYPTADKPNTIYYKFVDRFYQFDLKTKRSTEIELDHALFDTVRVKDMQWITKPNGTSVLAMITQYGEYMLINPSDKTVEFINLDIAAQSVAIQALETGFDGKLYLGGYQRGMSIYNPFTKEKEINISAFAQPEGIGFLKDRVYYGTYVGAIMQSFDPTKPLDLNSNPRVDYKITDQQDRPFAITNSETELFVGTVPDYGVLGGVLAIYDSVSDSWSQTRNVVQDQSIISLAYKDGFLYGGTSVWGGLGIDPSASEAKIFVWDVAKNEKVTEFTPDIPNIDEAPKMIGDLSFGPDGNLWGVVDGTLFALDTETNTVVKSKMIQPSLYNSSKWFPYRIHWSPDGMLYTTLSRKLIVVDPETLDHKTIVDEFMNNMTLGIDGSIYYAIGNELKHIAIPETDATLSEIKINGKTLDSFSPGTLRYTTNEVITSLEAVSTQTNATTTNTNRSRSNLEVHTIRVLASDGISELVYEITTDPNYIPEEVLPELPKPEISNPKPETPKPNTDEPNITPLPNTGIAPTRNSIFSLSLIGIGVLALILNKLKNRSQVTKDNA